MMFNSIDSAWPYFQFYARDFLADQRVCSMSFEARGVFITLLCHAWIDETIPADPIELARLLRTSPKKSARALRAVLPCFSPGPDGRLLHAGLEQTRDAVRTKSKQQTENARRRWDAVALPSQSRAAVPPACNADSDADADAEKREEKGAGAVAPRSPDPPQPPLGDGAAVAAESPSIPTRPPTGAKRAARPKAHLNRQAIIDAWDLAYRNAAGGVAPTWSGKALDAADRLAQAHALDNILAKLSRCFQDRLPTWIWEERDGRPALPDIAKFASVYDQIAMTTTSAPAARSHGARGAPSGVSVSQLLEEAREAEHAG